MTPFNNKKYKQLQKQEIANRISQFDKLYMEVGGKLFDDKHAERVLPGFAPDVKFQIFKELKNDSEIIFCVNARDIILNKTRGDNGLSYGDETLRLAKIMKDENITVSGIMINFYEPHESVLTFEKKCKAQKIKAYKSYFIEGYPKAVDHILSNEGFGKNEYIKTSKKLILVSAPGANSGKLETCLSQIYNDKVNGINSSYAKYETFPVWNLELDHLTNIAYEMATVDIKDKNIIDPFYKKTHHKNVTNYNRDVESFPIVSEILNGIMGKEVYDSPTSMGINCVGLAIDDDAAVQEASYEEILRRYEKHNRMFNTNKLSTSSLELSEKLLKKAEKLIKKVRRKNK